MQTENRSDHSVPPPELVNANENETQVDHLNRLPTRRRIKGSLEQSPEISNNVTRKDANVKESDKAGVNNPIENGQPSTEENEGQEPANAEEILVPTVNVQQQQEKVGDQVEQNEITGNDSLHSLDDQPCRLKTNFSPFVIFQLMKSAFRSEILM